MTDQNSKPGPWPYRISRGSFNLVSSSLATDDAGGAARLRTILDLNHLGRAWKKSEQIRPLVPGDLGFDLEPPLGAAGNDQCRVS